MNTKAWLALLLFLGWSGFSFWWVYNKKAACCNQAEIPATIPPPVTTAASSLPLYFNWSSNEPKQGDGFIAYRKQQIANLGPTDTLVINTWYYADEENGEVLARQRAEKLIPLFNDVDGSRIKITTERREGSADLKTTDFEAASFSVLTNQNSLVKRSGDKILIYFASNSSAKNLEKEINDYLTTLAADMQNNMAITVTATGYTDNVGNPAGNINLSKNRAEFVKSALVAKGIDAARVMTDGKGEADSIAPNDTEEGRKQNRRVELTIANQ